VSTVVDQLVLAAQLIVEDGRMVISHVVAVPVCSILKKFLWILLATGTILGSVVDPDPDTDPQGSETFSRIRI
jgi:hypothetical protein